MQFCRTTSAFTNFIWVNRIIETLLNPHLAETVVMYYFYFLSFTTSFKIIVPLIAAGNPA